MDRIRPLDGNTKRAVFSRGKPTYPMGSPNPNGINQHRGVKPMAETPDVVQMRREKLRNAGSPSPNMEKMPSFRTGGSGIGPPRKIQSTKPSPNAPPATSIGSGPVKKPDMGINPPRLSIADKAKAKAASAAYVRPNPAKTMRKVKPRVPSIQEAAARRLMQKK